MIRVGLENRMGLYRSRRGVIAGVCRGIADYLDVSVFWTRMIAIGLLIFTGLWPIVGIYLLGMVVMKPAPSMSFETEDDTEFDRAYVNSRGLALERLRRVFDKLDHRVQRVEDTVTAREYDWERRLRQTPKA